MKTKIKIGKKIYEIETEDAGENIRVKIDEEEFLFKKTNQKEILQLEKELAGEEILETFSQKEKEIKAPIAGTISEIFVKEGEEIKKGQKILTLFSMKMENEIVSEILAKLKK
jgi:biotin carboxyl carrier protein